MRPISVPVSIRIPGTGIRQVKTGGRCIRYRIPARKKVGLSDRPEIRCIPILLYKEMLVLHPSNGPLMPDDMVRTGTGIRYQNR
jgi:hypothetical protein